MRHKLLLLQFAVLVLVAILDLYFGIAQSFFWSISWWDIPVHMLGGLWVGLIFAYIATYSSYRISLIHCAVAAFIVGVGWEIFEYIFHFGGSQFMSYQLDTAKDLLDDIIGGTVAGFIVGRL